jgi:hypothetical protein
MTKTIYYACLYGRNNSLLTRKVYCSDVGILGVKIRGELVPLGDLSQVGYPLIAVYKR